MPRLRIDIRALAPWLIAAAALAVLPAIFTASSTLTILIQMSITVVFALSYNMLLGQAGMLSFGHAVYLGLGGFACIHFMNMAIGGGWYLPLPLIPLIAGLFSMGVATLIGAASVRRSGAVFAMISLGVVELVASLSIIIYAFFRGGGVGSDRTLLTPFFGVEFLRQGEIYPLVIGWALLAAALMYLYTRTPLGRMANAVRDNPERAEFLGYSSTMVRLYSFAFAGFFAGVAGGLFAVTYEITTVENLDLQSSGTILMIAFLGGTGVFAGPILGAVIFTMLQTLLSLETELWRLYIGTLFLAAVIYFPGGVAGVIAAHTRLRPGAAGRLIRPYAVAAGGGLLAVLSAAALLEMLHHLRHPGVKGDEIGLYGMTVDPGEPLPWLIAAVLLALGWFAARRAALAAIATYEAETKL